MLVYREGKPHRRVTSGIFRGGAFGFIGRVGSQVKRSRSGGSPWEDDVGDVDGNII